jgi:hypothetical protein
MGDNVRKKRTPVGIKYCREGGPKNPIWHITQYDWHPGHCSAPKSKAFNGGEKRKTVGYCMHIFRPELVRDERPDERVICCGCLAAERTRLAEQCRYP